MRFFLDAVGCRLNHSEMESLSRRLAGSGHILVQDPAQADICILNTCAVTGLAERKSRKAVNHIVKMNPTAQVILTGCYATLDPENTIELPGVSQIVCNKDKPILPDLIGIDLYDSTPCWYLENGRARAFVQAQDGCDNHCTFCVTTIARGPSTSRPLPAIINEIHSLVAVGYKEIVLSGVNLGAYQSSDLPIPLATPAKDKSGGSLSSLIRTILAETGVQRLRLSSIEPWDITPDFFDLWGDSRLCRQLHLPLQSGSNSVLWRMGRRMTANGYKELAKAALTAIPDLALTTDVIAGFPGETRQEHAESFAFIQSLDFARLHVFSFSARPGTVAFSMADQLDPDIIKQKSQQLRDLDRDIQGKFISRFIGRTMPVLWESKSRDGFWKGHTDNYIQVRIQSKENLRNTIVRTRLLECINDEMLGELSLNHENRTS